MQVIVHGGAGGAPDEPEQRQTVLDRAAEQGASAETPIDAVESAVGVLEAAPRFNAGTGGAIQSDGGVRTDAGIMTGDGEVGAACSMSGVERALEVARVVMMETPHVLLSGEHAVALAADYGVETGLDLKTERTRERWEQTTPPEGTPSEQLAWIHDHFGATGEAGPDADPSDHDTVGAVASDGDSVVAATSTGGRWYALAGRVGDVPQVGGGFFAAESGGASATGAGEEIAKTGLARRAVGLLDEGLTPDAAAESVIGSFDAETDASAGIIVADNHGRVGSAYNSEAMQTSAAGTVE
ncbi:asparaginase [Natronoarchaeum philippinense]|uniref:Plant-type L-asparaginase n=1 Tax=Natronoarchaeum philippinense TaxID=558529 RepID=A0A285NB27_NATPI|nr:isoaspartyl peptidase/L-asparaginase [Natronoarchaeum philippinense]SNZ06640.1 asparaginase [Natronoarchaeum philippinense]